MIAQSVLMPVVQWGALATMLVGVALLLAQESRGPVLMADTARREAVASLSGPYSLEDLYERLSPAGVEEIGRHIRYFTGEGLPRLQRGLARGNKYLASYRDLFRSNDMPEELAYLPLIESSFIPTVVSHAQAAGMWQFIASTGRMYNLDQNDYKDTRLDPFRSAQAAAQYLQHLHGQFNNWELALAAYNSGSGTVRWAIRRNIRENRPTDFFSLDLPDETTKYVPNFMAAVLIAKNPAAFGVKTIKPLPPLRYEHIKAAPSLPLDDLARVAGVQPSKLRGLNPSLIRGVVPPGDKPYRLRVPPGFFRELPGHVTGEQSRLRDYVVHKVTADDSVASLAARFGSKEESIRSANKLGVDADLYARNLVLIPL